MTETDRFHQIDAYRAYALFGLFFVHCVELFELHWYDPVSTPLFELAFLIFGGKAFAMFALSFGLSFSIIMARAKNRGETYELRYVWRLIVLLLIGVIHTALYRGDILVILALFGLILVPVSRMRNQSLLLFIGFFFLLNIPGATRIIAAYQGAPTAFSVLGNLDAVAMAAYMSGDILATIRANMTSGNLIKWLFMAESGRISQIIGLFFLGLVMGRMAFFTDLGRYRKVRMVLIAASVFLTVMIPVFKPAIISLFPASDGFEGPLLVSFWIDVWAAMAFTFAQTFVFFEIWYRLKGRGLRIIAPAGRMSLTLYVGQSVVMVPILYNFGLGWFDDVTMIQMTIVAFVGFAAQCLFAILWIRHFHYGPLEWLWRAMTRLSLDIPFKRTFRPVTIGARISGKRPY